MKGFRKHYRAILAVVLIFAMLCSLAACAEGEGSSGSAAQTDISDSDRSTETTEKQEDVELVMSFWCGTEPADLDKVFESLSELTKEKIGVTVKPFTVNMANYPQQTNLMLSSGEQIDLMCMYYEWFRACMPRDI